MKEYKMVCEEYFFITDFAMDGSDS